MRLEAMAGHAQAVYRQGLLPSQPNGPNLPGSSRTVQQHATSSGAHDECELLPSQPNLT